MIPTSRQMEIIESLHDCGYMTDNQYNYAITDRVIAYKIIGTSLEYKRRCRRIASARLDRLCGRRPTMKQVQDAMRVQGVYRSNYHGKTITLWTKCTY